MARFVRFGQRLIDTAAVTSVERRAAADDAASKVFVVAGIHVLEFAGPEGEAVWRFFRTMGDDAQRSTAAAKGAARVFADQLIDAPAYREAVAAAIDEAVAERDREWEAAARAWNDGEAPRELGIDIGTPPVQPAALAAALTVVLNDSVVAGQRLESAQQQEREAAAAKAKQQRTA